MSLGVPVIPMVAVKGGGSDSLMRAVIEVTEEERKPPISILYGPEVERRIEELKEAVNELDTPYPIRWIAIKLLEGDDEIRRLIYSTEPWVEELVTRLSTGSSRT